MHCIQNYCPHTRTHTQVQRESGRAADREWERELEGERERERELALGNGNFYHSALANIMASLCQQQNLAPLVGNTNHNNNWDCEWYFRTPPHRNRVVNLLLPFKIWFYATPNKFEYSPDYSCQITVLLTFSKKFLVDGHHYFMLGCW